MSPRFESRPILNHRVLTATLRGTVALEWGTQVGHGFHLFCIIGGSVVARNVANQEVLDFVGPSSLGWLYIAVALLSGTLLAGFGWVSRARDATQLTILTHGVAGATMLLAALFPPGIRATALAKYVLMEVAAAALLLAFGRLSGSRFAPREARKMAPRVGAGGILGGLAAGGILSAGATFLGSRWLFLVAAALVGLPLLWLTRTDSVQRFARLETMPREHHEPRSLAPYGRALATTAFLMVATTTLVDYQFRFSAKRWYGADELTAFFGYVVLISGIVAIVFQLTLLDRLLDRMGLFTTAAVMPVALAISGAAFGIAPLIPTLLVLKVVDSGTNMTVQQATAGLLLAPLSSRARSVWQSRIDGLARRGGQVMTGAFLASFPWPPGRVLPLTLALCAIWLLALVVTRTRYIRLLTDLLRSSGAEEPSIRPQDGETVRLLEAELENATPARAAIILDLLAEAGRRASLRSLRQLDPDGQRAPGAMLAIAHLKRFGDIKALTEFVNDRRSGVAVEALATIATCDLHVAQRLARGISLEKERAEPLRAAAAGLLADSDPTALRLARDSSRSVHTDTRQALARGLGATAAGGSQAVGELVAQLAADPDPIVATRALEALPRHATAEGIEQALVGLERRRTRGPAMRALAAVGPIAVERLGQELARRLAQPQVAGALAWALGRMASPSSIGALVEALWAPHAEVRLAAAMALNSLRRRRPGIVLPLAAIGSRYLPEIDAYARMRTGSHLKLSPTTTARLLHQLCKQRAQASLECLFRLLALRYPEEALRGTLLAVSSVDKRQRQIALELLDTLVDPEVRQALAHVDGDAVSRRSRDAGTFLTHIAHEGDAFLAALARRALAELGSPLPPRRAGTLEIDMSDTFIDHILELQSVSLFTHCSAEDLAELATLLTERTVKKGAAIFHEGDVGDALFLVRSGRVTVTRANQVLEQLGPGDALGIVAVLDQKPREVTATATSDCVLRILAADDLLELLAERPLFMQGVLRGLTQAIRGQLDRLALGKRSDVA